MSFETGQIYKKSALSLAKQAERIESNGLSSKRTLVLAIACSLTVANLYYIQPLLPELARSLGNLSLSEVGLSAPLAQLGYVLGLLVLVPLGDTLNRRKLIVTMLGVVSVALVAMALTTSVSWLFLSSLALGFTTITPQIIVPFAAHLATPQQRKRTVSIVTSGVIIGILLSRTLCGLISSEFGWRTMYWVAAGLMLILAGVLWQVLPSEEPKPGMKFTRLVASLWTLFRTEWVLRETSVLGGLAFASFNTLWVSLGLFLAWEPAYHYSSSLIVGLFGLVGVVGALGSPWLGQLITRHYGESPRGLSGVALGLSLAGFMVLWVAGGNLTGLILGILLLCCGVQMLNVSNQTRLYSLRPEVRSRLNTVYMIFYVGGGAGGSALSLWSWGQASWNGVCLTGLGLLTLAIAFYFYMKKK